MKLSLRVSAKQPQPPPPPVTRRGPVAFAALLGGAAVYLAMLAFGLVMKPSAKTERQAGSGARPPRSTAAETAPKSRRNGTRTAEGATKTTRQKSNVVSLEQARKDVADKEEIIRKNAGGDGVAPNKKDDAAKADAKARGGSTRASRPRSGRSGSDSNASRRTRG